MAPETRGHIMLSYQWDSQRVVLRVKEGLEQDGFKVWMDVDKLQGNIFQRMAEGIEGALLIIVCMTKKYEKSTNCNLELQYAQVKKKTIIPIKLENDFDPCGALGLIVAGCRYVNFTDHCKFRENLAELEKEIHSAPGGGISLPEQTWLKWVDKRCSSWNLAEDNIIEAVKEEVVTVEVPSLTDEDDNVISDDVCIFDVNVPKREDLNLANLFAKHSTPTNNANKNNGYDQNYFSLGKSFYIGWVKVFAVLTSCAIIYYVAENHEKVKSWLVKWLAKIPILTEFHKLAHEHSTVIKAVDSLEDKTLLVGRYSQKHSFSKTVYEQLLCD